MKHSCPISGLQWTSLPLLPNATPSVLKHPIFHLPYSELLNYVDSIQQSSGESLAEPETLHLLGLALLSHFPITFLTPVSPQAFPKILQHWDTILRLYIKLPTVPVEEYPHYVVSSSTATLDNLQDYLALVAEVHYHRSTKAAQQRLARQVLRKEEVISRLIGHPSSRTKIKLATLLPDWADLVCTFPRTSTTLADGSTLPLAEYWKTLIRLCVLNDTNELLKIATAQDLDELLYELEESLELGTSCSVLLLKYVRDTYRAFHEFSGSGIKFKSSVALDLSALEDQESSCNQQSTTTVGDDPTKPIRSQFPTVKEFIWALQKWSKAKKVAGH